MPRHGGPDPGTTYGEIYEKNINLKISQYLKNYLDYYGAKTIIIRDGDYDLSTVNAIYRKKSDFDNRIKIINNSSSDIYISIHLNYLNDAKYFGPQVFYGDKDLALNITKELKTDRDIKLIPNTTYMYEKLKIKGVLIECGFISNEYDRNKLITSSYQKQIAKNISKGIINYKKNNALY